MGKIRAQNEDALACREDAGFAVLSDGMGGHLAGEVASRISVEAFTRSLTSRVPREPGADPGPPGEAAPLVASTLRANEAVLEESLAEPLHHGMGCTLVALQLRDGRGAFVGVGDSRLYLLRNGSLLQVTEDHTRIRMLERMGVHLSAADRLSMKGIITRAIGTRGDLEVDYGVLPTWAGDVWLLCSDGLTDELDDAGIRSILLASPSAAAAADELVRAALERGGRDNVSVVVARVIESPAVPDDSGPRALSTFPPAQGP